MCVCLSLLYLLYLMCICCILCVFVLSYVYCVSYMYLLYLMCICCILCVLCSLCVFVVSMCICCTVCIDILTLDAGLLARSQYPEGPATGHLDTGFSLFPYVYKRMLRRFPSFQVATTCLSCSPPDLNFLVIFFSFFMFVYV